MRTEDVLYEDWEVIKVCASMHMSAVLHIYVCMYVCMYVASYICMYIPHLLGRYIV